MTKKEDDKKKAQKFYKAAIKILQDNKLNFMLGGGFALKFYTNIHRESKDLDIFCRSRDYPQILKVFEDKGYRTELTDARWLAKVHKDKHFMDVIFDSSNAICTVDDSWFDKAPKGKFEDISVLFIPPEELFWCKIYVQNRERYDGADLNHLVLKYGKKMDWKLILNYMDKHWQLLLSQILNFQFVYPADYAKIIPQWLYDELLNRAGNQYNLPATKIKICRGPIIDQTQYETDIVDWGYKVSTMKTV